MTLDLETSDRKTSKGNHSLKMTRIICNRSFNYIRVVGNNSMNECLIKLLL